MLKSADRWQDAPLLWLVFRIRQPAHALPRLLGKKKLCFAQGQSRPRRLGYAGLSLRSR